VRDVVTPMFTEKSRLDLTRVLKGVQRDGAVTLAGWAEFATKDSSVRSTFRSVDLLALQPYLIKAHEPRVQRGTLDLDLQSDVSKDRLKAPGKLTISGLELVQGKGAFDTFMGLPRDFVVASLKNKENKITVNFVLEGDVNDPGFSLNEALTTRLASSMAETLGGESRRGGEGRGRTRAERHGGRGQGGQSGGERRAADLRGPEEALRHK
jgi:hypothetical protein